MGSAECGMGNGENGKRGARNGEWGVWSTAFRRVFTRIMKPSRVRSKETLMNGKCGARNAEWGVWEYRL